jgi:hypothetical protein
MQVLASSQHMLLLFKAQARKTMDQTGRQLMGVGG